MRHGGAVQYHLTLPPVCHFTLPSACVLLTLHHQSRQNKAFGDIFGFVLTNQLSKKMSLDPWLAQYELSERQWQTEVWVRNKLISGALDGWDL